MTPPESDLLIVGAGAKAAAIAAKVHAINRLGLGPISLTIVEKTEPAASWLGRNGMTSGEEPLAIPPIKDVGFPYRSYRQFGPAGEAIDAAILPFTYQRYAIERHIYAPWVNSGMPSIRHRDYGEYLGWVLSQATEGVRLLSGRVTEVSLDRGRERWLVDVHSDKAGYDGAGGGESRLAGAALVLTGPGVHRAFPHDPGADARIFHCDSRREEFLQMPDDRGLEVAIVGGGESALSALVLLRALRPLARLTVYTPTLPMSRGESFLENRVFADPDDVGWSDLDLQTRRDFVKHCDRGVFDQGVLASIADDEGCAFATGRCVHVSAVDGGDRVALEYEAGGQMTSRPYDYVVNCTGFDLLAQLRGLFGEEARAEVESRSGPLWDAPPGTEVPIGRALELEGMEPRLHIPGLGGLRQGPGFANLGSLGLLANRVLEPVLAGLEGDRPSADPDLVQEKSLSLD
jgi:mycobactin lysine-N-oxygenase